MEKQMNQNDQKGRKSEFRSRHNHMKTLIYVSDDNPDKWIVETADLTMQRKCEMDGVFVGNINSSLYGI
jgi:hypothetical protein